MLSAAAVAIVGCDGGTAVAPPLDGSVGEDDGGPHDPACVHICDTVAPLRCPRAAECLSECEYQLRADCMNASRAWNECVKTKTISDFSCGSMGGAQAKSGVCPDQLAALMTCIFTGRDLP